MPGGGYPCMVRTKLGQTQPVPVVGPFPNKTAAYTFVRDVLGLDRNDVETLPVYDPSIYGPTLPAHLQGAWLVSGRGGWEYDRQLVHPFHIVTEIVVRPHFFGTTDEYRIRFVCHGQNQDLDEQAHDGQFVGQSIPPLFREHPTKVCGNCERIATAPPALGPSTLALLEDWRDD